LRYSLASRPISQVYQAEGRGGNEFKRKPLSSQKVHH
jgi:hypothetical protein